MSSKKKKKQAQARRRAAQNQSNQSQDEINTSPGTTDQSDEIGLAGDDELNANPEETSENQLTGDVSGEQRTESRHGREYPRTRSATNMDRQMQNIQAQMHTQMQTQSNRTKEEMQKIQRETTNTIQQMQTQMQAQNQQTMQQMQQIQAQMQQQMAQMNQMFQNVMTTQPVTQAESRPNQNTVRFTTAQIHSPPTSQAQMGNQGRTAPIVTSPTNQTVGQDTGNDISAFPTQRHQVAPSVGQIHRSKRMDTPQLTGVDFISLGDFRAWKKQFLGYAQVERLYDECTLVARRTILIGALDSSWQRLINAGTFKIEDTDDVEEIITKIGDHLRKHKNPILDRIAFSKRTQHDGEQVDSYHAALCILEDNASHKMNEKCDSCRQTKEERIRDRIITGLHDSSIQAAVLEVPIEELTLQKTLNICRAKEASCMTQTGMKDPNVHKIHTESRGRDNVKSEYRRERDRSRSFDRTNQCHRCGQSHENDHCWAKNATCHYCKKIGHIARLCQAKGKPDMKTLSTVVCGVIDEQNEALCKLMPITADVWNSEDKYKGKLYDVLPDTGAGTNLIGLEQAYRIGAFKRTEPKEELRGANGLPIRTIGSISATLKIGDVKKMVSFAISDEYKGVILNRQECEDFKIYTRSHSNAQDPKQPGGNIKITEDTMYEKPSKKDMSQVFEEVMVESFTEDDKHYLAFTDRMSCYPAIYEFEKPISSDSTIQTLLDLFHTFRCPDRISYYEGAPFTAHETRRFLKTWGVDVRRYRRGHTQNDEQAEKMLENLKKLIKKHGHNKDDFGEELMNLRNDREADRESPAEIVFGHRIRYRAEVHKQFYNPIWFRAMKTQEEEAAAQAMRDAYHAANDSSHTLVVGAKVVIQNHKTKRWETTGTIMGIGLSGDRKIKTTSGRIMWKNTDLLRPIETKNPGPEEEKKIRSVEACTKQDEYQYEDGVFMM